MFVMKKPTPPFGTDAQPVKIGTYSEVVFIRKGLCKVAQTSTRDRLLKMGFKLISEEGKKPVSKKPTSGQKPAAGQKAGAPGK